MKKNIKYLITFVFFMTILFLVPLAGDDWGNALVGGFFDSFKNAWAMYFSWEGRFISRLLINLLTTNKWIFNILGSFVIVSIIYLGVKLTSKNDENRSFRLVLLMILLMNIYMFSQTITWVAGSITYLFVIPVILWYFYYLLKHDTYNNLYKILFISVNIFGTMFVENMGAVLVAGNIILLIYKYFKNKKLDKNLIIYTCVSILSFLAMFLSPGSRYRSRTYNVEFNRLNIFQKVFINIPNFVNYTFISNPYLLLVMTGGNYLLVRKNIKNKYLKYGLIIFMLGLPLVTSGLYLLSLVSSLNLAFLIDCNNIFIIIYWFIYLGISFLLLISTDFTTVFIFLVGLVSNLAMLMSPVWGARTSLFTYLMLTLVYIRVICFNSEAIKGSKYLLRVGIIVVASIYLILYVNVYRCQQDLLKSIKKGLNNKDQVIYIERFPSFSSCNINPDDSFHMINYKKYYKIPDNVEVKYNDRWKYMIFYK